MGQRAKREPEPLTTAQEAAVARARAIVGHEIGAPLRGPVPANEAMAHHWARAIGDHNPAYLDPDVAATTVHEGVISPPAMLGVWTMDSPRGAGGPRDKAMRALDEAGFTSVVATNYTHEYLRQVRPGDRIAEERSIESMSELKATGLGDGFFVTTRYDYRDADGELVGIGRMKLLKFRPRAKAPATKAKPDVASMPRMEPAMNRDNAEFWEGVDAGELRIQRCTACQTLRHPWAPMCPGCQGTDWDTVAAGGTGVIHSHVVHHHPPLPGLTLPHTILLVQLDEGVRVVSHLSEAARDVPVAIGDRVRLVLETVPGDRVLPLFAPDAVGAPA